MTSPAPATLLITGGTGFIGSHTCLCLLESGYSLVVLDSLVNSSKRVLQAIGQLAGLQCASEDLWCHPDGTCRLAFVAGDVRSPAALNAAFTCLPGRVAGVVHLAGLKAVGESSDEALHYWDVNVGGTISLLKAMDMHGCQAFVFSSSAAVYGQPKAVPVSESSPRCPTNPYARTKATVEQILEDLTATQAGWRIGILRYFNPIGAHPSGLIGENPRLAPTNIFPVLCQVALGNREQVEVFGHDWPTPDGSGVRDFIHVLDLAEGHALAINALLSGDERLLQLNLGTGRGCSVFELIRCLERVSGRPISHTVANRRPGDVAVSIADPGRAEAVLGWKARRGLDEMCRDGWAWLSAPQS